MDDFTAPARHPDVPADSPGYRPPTITRLGDLAELTQQKEVGAADGQQFLGLDLGTV
jgi:hypothetical protein